MVNLSKSQPHHLCRTFYLATLLAAAIVIGLLYGHHQYKAGVKEGVRVGACYWELNGSNGDFYEQAGYYACRLTMRRGMPVRVHLTYDRPAEE